MNSQKTETKASLKQTAKKSSSPAEKKKPVLRFSPTAWAKLLYFRDKSDKEVGGFGITKPEDLLYVQEFITVKQEVTSTSVKFDDTAVANFFDDQVDLSRKPEQFARLWCHTHPGLGPRPSSIDEETFARVFGKCQWALIFILAEKNKTYARLSFNVGPRGQILLPVEVDYSQDFGPTDKAAWDDEYEANIQATEWLSEPIRTDRTAKTTGDYSSLCLPYDFLEEFEKMEPAERQFVLDELADRPELWDEESEVMFL